MSSAQRPRAVFEAVPYPKPRRARWSTSFLKKESKSLVGRERGAALGGAVGLGLVVHVQGYVFNGRAVDALLTEFHLQHPAAAGPEVTRWSTQYWAKVKSSSSPLPFSCSTVRSMTASPILRWRRRVAELTFAAGSGGEVSEGDGQGGVESRLVH